MCNTQALVEMNTVEDAVKVYNHFSEQKLVILGNAVDLKFSHYDQLVKPEEQVLSQCVLLVSIICRDNSTLSLRHFYSVTLFAPVSLVDLQPVWQSGSDSHVHSSGGSSSVGSVQSPL